MARYVTRRILQAVVVLWLLTVIVFVISRLSGNPVDLLLPQGAPPSQRVAMIHELGLDRSIVLQVLDVPRPRAPRRLRRLDPVPDQGAAARHEPPAGDDRAHRRRAHDRARARDPARRLLGTAPREGGGHRDDDGAHGRAGGAVVLARDPAHPLARRPPRAAADRRPQRVRVRDHAGDHALDAAARHVLAAHPRERGLRAAAGLRADGTRKRPALARGARRATCSATR